MAWLFVRIIAESRYAEGAAGMAHNFRLARQNEVLVKVEVNGRPAVLIVDTASNHTIISSELADAPPRNLDSVVATSKGSGFAGAGVFTRATLKVGPITWRDHKVVAMDMRAFSKSLGQKADGMLGMDFFSEFELVVVDLKNHKLILEP
jgi:predicted aspartyl protease